VLVSRPEQDYQEQEKRKYNYLPGTNTGNVSAEIRGRKYFRKNEGREESLSDKIKERKMPQDRVSVSGFQN